MNIPQIVSNYIAANYYIGSQFSVNNSKVYIKFLTRDLFIDYAIQELSLNGDYNNDESLLLIDVEWICERYYACGDPSRDLQN